METARCRAFLAAAETGSFSKAAEALRYTPSGVNQLVSALEKEFGFPLFRRNTKGVSLTENGELLLPVIRKFLRQEDRIFELSAEMNGLLIGSVNIAAYSSIATHWLPVDPPASITLGIALHSRADLSPAVRRFLKYAVRMLTKQEKHK